MSLELTSLSKFRKMLILETYFLEKITEIVKNEVWPSFHLTLTANFKFHKREVRSNMNGLKNNPPVPLGSL